jgi:uncharacterized protein YbjT (DUF2867 family)
MKNVIITGATGMVGGLVLQECISNPEIGKITSLTRRDSSVSDDKLSEIIIENFTDYSGKENLFKNVDIAYFFIGVYTGTVSREIFREITVDYTIAFADVLKRNSPNAAFCFLSGAGADRSEKSRMMFAKDKGIAENYLLKLNFQKTHIFRPAYIYPVTPREEPNLTYRLSRKLYPVLKGLMPKAVITSEQLAKAIFKIGLYGGELETYENKDIRKII